MTLTTFASRFAAALVAAVAGFSSYRHIYDVASAAGEHHAVALALPLSIDGLIVVGTMALLEDKRSNRQPRTSARFALAFGVLATLAANVASAQPTPTARAVAAVPAIAFLIAVEVLARSGKPKVSGDVTADVSGQSAPAMIEPASAEVGSGVTDDISPHSTDPREAARKAYRASVAEGAPLSGAALARRFGKSPRWGVDRVAEVRAERVNGHRPDVEVPA